MLTVGYAFRFTDPVAELAKVAEYVGSVHLKDSDGTYRSSPSPPLGQGVVDFPAIFAMLGEQDFTGPYSIELEGMVDVDEAARLKLVADCVAYLGQIGVFGDK